MKQLGKASRRDHLSKASPTDLVELHSPQKSEVYQIKEEPINGRPAPAGTPHHHYHYHHHHHRRCVAVSILESYIP